MRKNIDNMIQDLYSGLQSRISVPIYINENETTEKAIADARETCGNVVWISKATRRNPLDQKEKSAIRGVTFYVIIETNPKVANSKSYNDVLDEVENAVVEMGHDCLGQRFTLGIATVFPEAINNGKLEVLHFYHV